MARRSVAKAKNRIRRRPLIDPKGETFHDVEKLIWSNVWKFVEKYGPTFYGTPDELFAECCVTFVRAYDKYEPDEGPFEAYLQMKLSFFFMSKVRNKADRWGWRKEPTPFSLSRLVEEPPNRRPRGRWERWVVELSDDARTVVRLIVESPLGLLSIFKRQAKQPRDVRLLLRNYLNGSGWSHDRISAAYREIEEGLP